MTSIIKIIILNQRCNSSTYSSWSTRFVNCIMTEDVVTSIHPDRDHETAIICYWIINIVEVSAINFIISTPHFYCGSFCIPKSRSPNDTIRTIWFKNSHFRQSIYNSEHPLWTTWIHKIRTIDQTIVSIEKINSCSKKL